MSEQDFVNWCDDEKRAEWVDGEVQLMSPVALDHARIVGFLSALMQFFVSERDLGEILTEPFQVRFAALRRRRSPDIIFVGKARASLFAKTHFEGAPDLAIEVVSPESQTRDRREKYGEYQAAGVQEYWLIDPLTRQIELHVLDEIKRYKPVLEDDGKLHSEVISGFYLRPAWLWQVPLPKLTSVIEELNRIGG